MEFMHLIGAENVERAASGMREAAQEMQRAVNSLEWSLEQQRRFMDEWLGRLEALLANQAVSR